jgi:predicted RNA-binding Zn ribbon-like protein
VSALRLSAEHAAWAELAATLVNTRPRATDPAEKLVGVPELSALLARCPEPAPTAGARDLDPMRELRPVLVEAFEATSSAAFAEAVNPLLARSRWQLTAGGDDGLTLGPVAQQRPADWFATHAARGLAELVIAYGIERLHMCSADDCLCAVVDVSRNGRRRYCSRTCANRTNTRRHREREDPSPGRASTRSA